MGRSIARRSSRHLIDSFAPGPIYSQRFTEVSVFPLLKDHLYRVIHLFPIAVVSLGLRCPPRNESYRLNGTSHPSGSRSAVKLVFLCDPCPLLRTQKIFGSRPCPIRRLQISWLLANPWGLTAWAVKTLMTYEGRGGTVDQSGFVVFHQPHSGFSVPAQILTQIIFLDKKPLDPS
jgi:hypothetical protein